MSVDNWEKHRNRGTGLTEEEKSLIRQAFRAGRPAKDVARELKCATRTVNKYYSLINADGGVDPAQRKERAPLPDRFYRSNFEL